MKLISFPVEVALRLLKCGKAPMADFVRLLTQEIDVGEMSCRELAARLGISKDQALRLQKDFTRFATDLRQDRDKQGLEINTLTPSVATDLRQDRDKQGLEINTLTPSVATDLRQDRDKQESPLSSPSSPSPQMVSSPLHPSTSLNPTLSLPPIIPQEKYNNNNGGAYACEDDKHKGVPPEIVERLRGVFYGEVDPSTGTQRARARTQWGGAVLRRIYQHIQAMPTLEDVHTLIDGNDGFCDNFAGQGYNPETLKWSDYQQHFYNWLGKVLPILIKRQKQTQQDNGTLILGKYKRVGANTYVDTTSPESRIYTESDIQREQRQRDFAELQYRTLSGAFAVPGTDPFADIPADSR